MTWYISHMNLCIILIQLIFPTTELRLNSSILSLSSFDNLVLCPIIFRFLIFITSSLSPHPVQRQTALLFLFEKIILEKETITMKLHLKRTKKCWDHAACVVLNWKKRSNLEHEQMKKLHISKWNIFGIMLL